MYLNGVRTVDSLIADGLPRTTINYRCRTGRWTRLLPGVVATGEVDVLERCRAVALWRPGAVFSHDTAAWLWGLCAPPDTVRATVPRVGTVRAPEWLRLHRRHYTDGDVASRHGMAVFHRERALLDCAGLLPEDEVDRLVDAAVLEGVTLQSLAAHCVVDRGREGVVATRRQSKYAAVDVCSEPERLLARAFARRGMRLPSNRSVRGWRTDFVDELSTTVVEVDGLRFHSEPDVFRSDRRRQNDLLSTHMVLRYAAADVFADADAVATDAIAVIRRRRAARR